MLATSAATIHAGNGGSRRLAEPTGGVLESPAQLTVCSIDRR